MQKPQMHPRRVPDNNNKLSTETEPIVVDDWLRSVDRDLVTCECTGAEKVRFTTHLLEGPTIQWWETYQITHPLETLTWENFKEGFRNAHISSGIMNLKQEEFRNLRQGNRSFKEWLISMRFLDMLLKTSTLRLRGRPNF